MRLYCPNLPASGSFELPPDEALHATKVMRLRVGDRCHAFDGLGNYAAVTIESIARQRVSAAVQEFFQATASSAYNMVLAVGLPRGDRQRSVIERATELGIDELVPLECEFGVAIATDNALERARRTVIESCKQCRRNRLMPIHEPAGCKAWFHTVTPPDHSSLRLICHPGRSDSTSCAALAQQVRSLQTNSPWRKIYLAVGPEGGFSDEEVASAILAGWQPLDLGPLILRVETAITVAAAQAQLLLSLQST